MNKQILGNKIRTLRNSVNLSQRDLATLLYITPQAISKWELGVGCPDISILKQLCNILNTTVDDLLDQ